jgi:hypothetical protein
MIVGRRMAEGFGGRRRPLQQNHDLSLPLLPHEIASFAPTVTDLAAGTCW